MMKFSRSFLLIIFAIAIQSSVLASPSVPKLSYAEIQKDTLVQAEKRTFLPIMSEARQNIGNNTFYKLFLFYFNKSSFLFRIILFLNLFFLSTAVVLIFSIFIKRLEREYVIYREKKCRDRYSTYITNWIYDKDNNAVPASLIKELESPISRNVFTSELISLHDNLSGESGEKLEELFLQAGLKKYAIQKTHSFYWHVKAMGFRELALMKINTENQLITKYLDSNNYMLRMEAMLAVIQLNPEDPLIYFDNPKIQFTEWGQINSLIALKKIGSVPDFGNLMQSSNKSSVIFALKMAGIFKQFDTAELVTERLNDRDEQIRREAIIALGKMELPDSNSNLIEIFPGEDTANKAEILRSMILSRDNQNAAFFEKVLLHETDLSIRILSAKGLVQLGEEGSKIFDSINYQADTKLKLIIIHAKDKRI